MNRNRSKWWRRGSPQAGALRDELMTTLPYSFPRSAAADVERIIPVHYPADNRKVMDKELLIAIGKAN